jgi:hypothetical protein
LNQVQIPPSISSSVDKLFSGICNLPQFISLIQAWGPENFTVQEDSAGGVYTAAVFVELWISQCTNSTYGPGITECSFEEYWTGYLSNDSDTGPFVLEGPVTVHGGGPSAPLSTVFGVGLGELTLVSLLFAAIIIGLYLVFGRRTGHVSERVSEMRRRHQAEDEPFGTGVGGSEGAVSRPYVMPLPDPGEGEPDSLNDVF